MTAYFQAPKWPKINLKRNKLRENEYDWLKMYVGKFFGVGKLKMNSEIQNFKILTPFVTSRTPEMTQNGPKIT